MPILINNIQERTPVSEQQLQLLEQTLDCGLRLHGKPDVEVSVILADNPYIQELNAMYRHIDQPTDVLSFAMAESAEEDPFNAPEEAPELLGDIFISMERAVEQAAAYGHSFQRELCFLAVHGLLHLLGFDHQEPEETVRMRQEEERILTEFDLGRTPK